MVVRSEFDPDSTFDQWWLAARQYAASHPELDLWEFQVEEMASDWAWRWEGVFPTPELMEDAYEDWINGGSLYSVHSRARAYDIEDGYDFKEYCRRRKAEAREKYRAFGLSKGIEEWQIDRFLDDIGIELFFREDEAERKYRDWIDGTRWSRRSPYYIPLEPENIAEREERLAYLRSKNPDTQGWVFELWFTDADDYGNLYYEEIAEYL